MAISAKMVNELRQKTGAGMMDCKRALQETDGDMEKAVMYLRQKGMASAGKKALRVAAEGKVEIVVTDDARSGALVEVNSETDFVARGDDFQNFCKLVAGKVVDLSDEQLQQKDLFDDLRKEMVSKTNENVVVRRYQRYRLPEADKGRVECYLHMGGKIGVMIQATVETQQAAESEDFVQFCREIAMHVAAASPQYLRPEDVPEETVKAEKELYRQQALDSGKPEKVAEKMIAGRLRKWYGEFCLLEQPWVREQKQTITQVCEQLSQKLGEKVTISRYARFQLGEGIEKKTTDLAAEVQAQVEASQKG